MRSTNPAHCPVWDDNDLVDCSESNGKSQAQESQGALTMEKMFLRTLICTYVSTRRYSPDEKIDIFTTVRTSAEDDPNVRIIR
jgi:hypothetical protein